MDYNDLTRETIYNLEISNKKNIDLRKLRDKSEDVKRELIAMKKKKKGNQFTVTTNYFFNFY